jgi:hypothetical protein
MHTHAPLYAAYAITPPSTLHVASNAGAATLVHARPNEL